MLKESLQASFKDLKIETVHGSRDYYHITFNEILFEVIPIIEIDEAKEALNITDISPLHAKWVNSNGVELCDEIRLLKQFAKAQKVYGAESYISGFSGYILEILTVYYGSFEKLLEKSSSWKSPVVIDVEKYYKKQMVFFELNKSKLQSPIICIDPVDQNRNASAALSVDKFNLFKKKAKEFLKNPNESFFEIPTINKEELEEVTRQKKTNLIYLEMVAQEGKKDVIGARLLKVFNFISKNLKGFTLKEADWEWSLGEVAKMYFFVSKKNLPKTHLVRGPPTSVVDHAKSFSQKHKNVLEKDGILYAKEETKNPKLTDFVNSLLEDNYSKERVEGIKLVKVTYSEI